MLISVMDLFPVYDLFPNIIGNTTGLSRERANPGVTDGMYYFCWAVCCHVFGFL